jgi:DNA polymerase III sliding clamp (beta) subunit (PCNA family)
MTVAVIDRKDLDAALRDVKPACSKSNKTLPVLTGVRLAFRDSRLTLETTDLDRSITLSVPLAEPGARGEMVVPLTAFERALKHRTGLLELEVKDGRLEVGANGSRSFVDGLNLADWPNIVEPAGTPVTVTEAMAAGIKRVAVAASREDSRPVLCGVHFERGYIVATDSYRLAVAGPFQPMPGMLVPAGPLVAAATVGSEMAYDADRHSLMILNGAKETIIHTIEAEFPKWRTLDTAKPEFKIRFSRAAAIGALKRAESAIRGDITPVRMTRRKDRRGVQFDVMVGGQQVLSEQVAGAGTMPDLVAFNPTFFREGCESCTGQSVEMWFTDSLKPAKLVDGFFSYLLMPVRVS